MLRMLGGFGVTRQQPNRPSAHVGFTSPLTGFVDPVALGMKKRYHCKALTPIPEALRFFSHEMPHSYRRVSTFDMAPRFGLFGSVPGSSVGAELRATEGHPTRAAAPCGTMCSLLRIVRELLR